MNLKKIKEKKVNLDKIYKIIESKKNITLVNILKLSKEILFYLQRSNFSKDLITLLNEKFSIDNSFLSKSPIIETVKGKKIWVYITEEEKYGTNSYQKHYKTLTENADFNEDLFILIGEKSQELPVSTEQQILFKSDENIVLKLIEILPKLIINIFKQYKISELNFVINSSKIKQKYITLFPLEKNNFELTYYSQKGPLNTFDLDKYKIHPEPNLFVESLFEHYLTFSAMSLLMESALVKEKYNLVAQNKSLNDLEEKIRKHKILYLRTKKDLEIEEISILSPDKDLIHTQNEVSHG
ncbi:hypothetical protein NPA08_01205 [Mycoplasmopsis citelli]|uniref:MSC_0622 family F1-like ATPase gamma subunit n=1 Tax=Mycoplasmopsis citelli TaxID=171281 RepID=UPI0021145D5F|nr:hypothetical protein [Mycoplasmopsis citelli]UUD36439.1 hypothetical protein NPA08_01205 [Mycoplasmopsis citelli]